MIARPDQPIRPFDAIASKFHQPKGSQTPLEKTGSVPGDRSFGTPPLLTPESISVPALFFSKELRITWHNQMAGTQIWHEVSLEEYCSSDVFDILFSTAFQKTVHNWRQWVALFIQQALHLVSADQLERIFSQKTDRQSEALLAMLIDFNAVTEKHILCGRIPQINPISAAADYQVVCIECQNGRLMLFEPMLQSPADNAGPSHKITGSPFDFHARAQEQPVRMTFFVLSLGLDNAEALAAEMLANEYTRLLSRLWGTTKETIERYQGVFAPHSASSMLGYFADSRIDENAALNVIQCALELKKRMIDLNREWKIQKGWLHDIELNMAIHRGHEFLSRSASSFGNSLIPMGKALDVATSLSTVISNGQIWSSKEVVDLLPTHMLDALRFGIFRHDQTRQIFIPRCFSRIRDLEGAKPKEIYIKDEIGACPVTQIFDYQSTVEVDLFKDAVRDIPLALT